MDRTGPVVHRSFLFTDIEGSTRLWERVPMAMPQALRLHDRLLQETVSAHGGTVFKTVGDAICAVFPSPAQAVLAAVEAQRRLTGAAWHELGLPEQIRVRMAIHAGEVQEHDGDFAGPVLNRLARLLAAGHGGQVLIAGPVAEQVRGTLPKHVELRDLGERRLRDVPGTERIVQLAIEGLPSTFPPLRTLETIAHNLPIAPTPCIGREEELRQLRAHFPRSASRLVTLLGPGGIGKTRLALQAATDLLDEFPDGVWFVDLTPVREAGLVAGTVIRSLGIREEAGRSAEETLLAWLEQRELLLVLDNCEQAIEEVAHMAAGVLRDAPRVRMLATSRAPLGVWGEQRMPVEPLALPQDKREPDYQHIQETASVQLFVARARAVRPAFALSAANAPHVAAICRRVDGIPLALELAAARVTVLSPEALKERLDLLLPILRSGARDAPERHQTLRDAIRWSYELLSPGEQTVFRGLAVFAGGWSLSAAAAVLGHDLEADLLDVLESLAAQSLIRAEPGEYEEPRFSMLETIRAFAMERLAETGEEARFRNLHAGFFLRMAEEAAPWLVGGEQQYAWMRQIDLEYGNLRAAVTWWLSEGQAAMALQLCANIWHYWSIRGSVFEGLHWLREALDHAVESTPELRARALRKLGNLSIDVGDTQTARTLYEESLALERDHGNVVGIAESLTNLGMVANMQGRYGEDIQLLEESRRLWNEIGDIRGEAVTLHNLAIAARDQGDLTQARNLYHELLSLQRQLGDAAGMGWSWLFMGKVERDLGNIDDSEKLANRALEVFQIHEDESGIAYALNGVATAAFDRRKLAEARSLHRQARTMHERRGDRTGIAQSLEGLAFVAFASGEPIESVKLLSEAAAIRDEVGEPVPAGDHQEIAGLERSLRDALGDRAYLGLCMPHSSSGVVK
jgi:predicted ATPase/class 3 adenylate cyclase